MRLVTIPFSHYCEKARWALDRAGLVYEEEPHLPIVSWKAAVGAGRSRTVPVLVTDDDVLTDSTDILQWVQRRAPRATLYPDDVAADVVDFEDLFDRRLGPAARRVAYFHLTKDAGSTRALFQLNVPRWQALASRALTPAIVAAIKRGLKVDPDHAERSEHTIAAVFAEVELRLADGRRWLTGDRFTAADLTFASLASPLILPAALAKWGLTVDLAPADLREAVLRYRDTRAGRFATRAYEEQRDVVLP